MTKSARLLILGALIVGLTAWDADPRIVEAARDAPRSSAEPRAAVRAAASRQVWFAPLQDEPPNEQSHGSVDYFELLGRLRKPDTRFQYLARRVPSTVAREVLAEIDARGFSGVSTERDPVRDYPAHDVAANLVGFMNAEGDAAEGAELMFDDLLSGVDGSATYEQGAPRITVTLRIDPAVLGALADVVGMQAVRSAERIQADDPDGWMHLRVTADWPEEVPGRLIGLGSRAEILDPPEVRERAIALARRMLERHGALDAPVPVRTRRAARR